MLEFLTAQANFPFAIGFILVVALGLIELLAMFAGLSLLNALDDLIPLDLDYDADVAEGGATGLLGWLCLDRLPLLIWFVLAVTSFAIAGYSVNFVYAYMAADFLPQFLSLPLAIIFSLFACRYVGAWLASVLPKNESSAVSVNELGGRMGTITVGCAQKGKPAEAMVRDDFNQKHYVMVEPEIEQEEFPTGTQVVLLTRTDRVWSAAKFTQE